MEQHLKERLVGAVVLMAAAVVFIPMILSGPRMEAEPEPKLHRPAPPAPPPTRFSSRIVPLGVQAEPVPAPAPESPPPPRPAQGEQPSARAPALAPAAVQPAPPPRRADAPAAARSGWVVQLGSFSNPRNAHALRDRLKGAGYTAFAESSGSGPDVVTRVFVGPEPQREDAEKQLARLAREIRLKGIVLRYPVE